MSQAAAFRGVVHSPVTRRLVLAYGAFAVCEYATWIGILVHAYAEGGAGRAGVVALLQLLPAAAAAVLAGPTAERLGPARVLTGSYAVQAVSAALTAVSLLVDATPVLVYGGAVALSTAVATVRPVQAAILPAVARRADELTACNVVVGWVENSALLVAGVATGVALRVASVGALLAGAAGLLAVATLLAARLPRVVLGTEAPRDPHASGGVSTADSVAASVRELRRVWRRPPAGVLGGLLGTEFVLVGALDLLFVVLAVDVLDAGEQWAGYLNTAFGAGALAGAVAAALLLGRRLGPALAATALVGGLALAAAAYVTIGGVVLLLAVAGACRALFDVSARVLLQRSVPPDDAARLFGAVEGLSMLGLAAGSLLVPLLVALGGSGTAVVGTALLLPLHVLLSGRRLARADGHAKVPVVEMALLRQLPVFRVLPPAALEGVAQGVRHVRFLPGEAVVRQGEVGRAYYAIASGAVRIEQDGRPIATVGPGQGLGEVALIRSVPRTATAVATTAVAALELDRESFLSAVTGHVSTLDRMLDTVVELEDRDRRRRDAGS